jgi:hypothetical protein
MEPGAQKTSKVQEAQKKCDQCDAKQPKNRNVSQGDCSRMSSKGLVQSGAIFPTV